MMNDDILSLIKDIVIVVLIYLVYFIVVKKRIDKANENSKAARVLKEGNSVTAKLINKQFHPGEFGADLSEQRESYWTATYEYFVNGISYTKCCTRYSEFTEQQITVYYYPNNPKKAYSLVEAKSPGRELAGCVRTIMLKPPLFYLVYKILLLYIKSM